MFQLIVAVISIALIAVLAIASIYYGGTAFNQGQMKGQVTALVNAGQQLAGAQALYSTDFGAKATGLTALVPAYVVTEPSKPAAATGAWSVNGTSASIALGLTGDALRDFCIEVSKQSGVIATDAATAITADLVGKQFGCVGSATAANFEFRV